MSYTIDIHMKILIIPPDKNTWSSKFEYFDISTFSYEDFYNYIHLKDAYDNSRTISEILKNGLSENEKIEILNQASDEILGTIENEIMIYLRTDIGQQDYIDTIIEIERTNKNQAMEHLKNDIKEHKDFSSYFWKFYKKDNTNKFEAIKNGYIIHILYDDIEQYQL